MKILIIEDDSKIRAYIEKGLKEAGHTADLAEDGETGLHLASTEKYDALIVDRMLPKLDGQTCLHVYRLANYCAQSKRPRNGSAQP